MLHYHSFDPNYYDLNNTNKEWSDVLSNISENSEYLNNNQEENNTIIHYCFSEEKPTSREKDKVLSEKEENHINKYTNKCNFILTTKEISKNKISQAALSQFSNPEKNDEKVKEELYFLNKKTKRDRNIKTKNKFENNEADYKKERKLSHEINIINNNHQIECIELEEDKKIKFGRKKKRIQEKENIIKILKIIL